MATILAHIIVRPGCEARFEAIARELYEATHTDETGVRSYQYWRGAEPRSYYTLLAFDDHRAFITHQTSDHHETQSPTLREVTESIRLEWIDPIEGASPDPATEHQDAPADADPLVSDYTDRFAAAVPDWWQPLRSPS